MYGIEVVGVIRGGGGEGKDGRVRGWVGGGGGVGGAKLSLLNLITLVNLFPGETVRPHTLHFSHTRKHTHTHTVAFTSPIILDYHGLAYLL